MWAGKVEWGPFPSLANLVLCTDISNILSPKSPGSFLDCFKTEERSLNLATGGELYKRLLLFTRQLSFQTNLTLTMCLVPLALELMVPKVSVM